MKQLTKAEAASPLWADIKAEVEVLIESARRKLENDCGPDLTAKLRGEIKAYRRLLAMEPSSRAVVPISEDDMG